MNEAGFQAQFESATLAYQPAFRADDRPVVVSIADDAESPAGDALLCGLVNQLARTHRHLVLVGDLDRPLLCRDPFGKKRLLEATAGNAKAINPLLAVDMVERAPKADAIAHLSIGGRTENSLGCAGWRASAGKEAKTGESADDVWGAMLASTLGAWFAFMRLLGKNPQLNGTYSLWNYGKAGAPDGPRLDCMPDLGNVLQVGAGGVGAALDYWLAMVRPTGHWVIVDGDSVEVGNLNRQLIFNAADAGYPDGDAANKAEVAAKRLGESATASACWYGDNQGIVDASYDVVLALANERGAREALQDRGGGVLLHATTSANHQAQLHRHLLGIDDCIRCRLPGAVAQTACGTASVTETTSDAALPYLSGLAGLLLMPALARLSSGQLADDNSNLALVDLGGDLVVQQSLRLECRESCVHRRG
ncbi:MAG TPA: ThiF family adenylyltransferase [Solirubrobacterales bacterium]